VIIDAHTHIKLEIDQNKEYHVTQRTVNQYLADYQSLGIQACFTFGSGVWRKNLRKVNEALASFNQQNPGRVYAWGTVSPALEENQLRAEIRYAIKELGLFGLKFLPICQGVSLANPGFEIVAEEAIALNVPVTTHDGSPEYCSAIQVAYYARKFPKLRVLSAHAGLRELWPDLIDAAKKLPNLYICLSGPTQWGLQSLYDALGPEKLLFGSDGGAGSPALTTAYLRRIDRLRAPDRHKQMILGENALRFINNA
jgi:predicted TIM-barrel fold metal-dependent hydrolase